MIHPLLVIIAIVFASCVGAIMVMKNNHVEHVNGSTAFGIIIGYPFLIVVITWGVNWLIQH